MTVVALGEAVGGVPRSFAEDGDPIVGGRPIDPVAMVVAGAVVDGDVEVGVGLAGVLARSRRRGRGGSGTKAAGQLVGGGCPPGRSPIG